MASRFRYHHDPPHGAVHHSARLSSPGPYDLSGLHVSWIVLEINNQRSCLISFCPCRRAIVPIGAFFSLSLICGNLAYLYLSVSFIQMLKVNNFDSVCKTAANLIRLPTLWLRCLLLGPWALRR